MFAAAVYRDPGCAKLSKGLFSRSLMLGRVDADSDGRVLFRTAIRVNSLLLSLLLLSLLQVIAY